MQYRNFQSPFAFSKKRVIILKKILKFFLFKFMIIIFKDSNQKNQISKEDFFNSNVINELHTYSKLLENENILKSHEFIFDDSNNFYMVLEYFQVIKIFILCLNSTFKLK